MLVFRLAVLVSTLFVSSCAHSAQPLESKKSSEWLRVSDRYRLNNGVPQFLEVKNVTDQHICGAASDFFDGSLLYGMQVTDEEGHPLEPLRGDFTGQTEVRYGYNILVLPPGSTFTLFNNPRSAFPLKDQHRYTLELSIYLMSCDAYFEAPFRLPSARTLLFFKNAPLARGEEPERLRNQMVEEYGERIGLGWTSTLKFDFTVSDTSSSLR